MLCPEHDCKQASLQALTAIFSMDGLSAHDEHGAHEPEGEYADEDLVDAVPEAAMRWAQEHSSPTKAAQGIIALPESLLTLLGTTNSEHLTRSLAKCLYKLLQGLPARLRAQVRARTTRRDAVIGKEKKRTRGPPRSRNTSPLALTQKRLMSAQSDGDDDARSKASMGSEAGCKLSQGKGSSRTAAPSAPRAHVASRSGSAASSKAPGQALQQEQEAAARPEEQPRGASAVTSALHTAREIDDRNLNLISGDVPLAIESHLGDGGGDADAQEGGEGGAGGEGPQKGLAEGEDGALSGDSGEVVGGTDVCGAGAADGELPMEGALSRGIAQFSGWEGEDGEADSVGEMENLQIKASRAGTMDDASRCDVRAVQCYFFAARVLARLDGLSTSSSTQAQMHAYAMRARARSLL